MRHVIAQVRFPRRSEVGPLTCSCGESMPSSEYAQHIKAVGQKPSTSALRLPHMLAESSWWEVNRAKQRVMRGR